MLPNKYDNSSGNGVNHAALLALLARCEVRSWHIVERGKCLRTAKQVMRAALGTVEYDDLIDTREMAYPSMPVDDDTSDETGIENLIPDREEPEQFLASIEERIERECLKKNVVKAGEE